ncbi:S8 family serine peptidase [Pelagibius sp.]|uniref:S8 family peptidase n=1 Tax=Pelagibius sp. TaxID=1931238 RepID=UPI002604D131|nr:S8 family serine peptidase [Pelagibius sp.]
MNEEDVETRIAQNVNEDTFQIPTDEEVKEKWEEINKSLERSSLLYDFHAIWQSFQGEGIKVAVLDSGIDIDHPAFPDDVFDSFARVENRRITRGRHAVQDFNGHGTHCAGIIAARPLKWHKEKSKGKYIPYEPIWESNAVKAQKELADKKTDWGNIYWLAKGRKLKLFSELDGRFSGVAPRAKLMIYKITKHDGEDDNGKPIDRGVAKVVDLALAIRDAVDEGADIISISIQSDIGTEELYDAIHYALDKKRIVICSAGNRGRLQQINVGYPARFGGVITVAAVTRFGQPSGFTSVGGEIDVGAPGESVWSTWKDNSYAKQSGTSMAAPWVAGIAALLLSKHRWFSKHKLTNKTPIRNNEEMRQHILMMATHPGHYDPYTGYGALWPCDYLSRGSTV